MAVPSLCIAIPALNEEEAIESTLRRCLLAKSSLIDENVVGDVEIVVISDGSTDRTPDIVRTIEGVRLIEFEQNRGYGAAIKAGWKSSHAELLGVLDADGTCDPMFFKNLCHCAISEANDIVLGSRLGPESKMPRLRRVGNRVFALILGVLCGRFVSDTASGMRVVRRSILPELEPLPDGLHFTPSMSARALISGVRIVELPMNYAERIGTSKLNVIGDGFRFLQTIFDGVLYYRPDRIFLILFSLCLLGVGLMGLFPIEFYWAHGRIEEWMIYRFVACFLLSEFGALLLSAIAISHLMAALGPRGRPTDSFWSALIARTYLGKASVVLVGLYWAAAGACLWPGIVEYVTTLTCTLHWSRLIVGSFFLLVGFQSMITSVLLSVIEMWRDNAARLAGRAP
jgi:glycosyltransferase involved in cell wall biosynthesis